MSFHSERFAFKLPSISRGTEMTWPIMFHPREKTSDYFITQVGPKQGFARISIISHLGRSSAMRMNRFFSIRLNHGLVLLCVVTAVYLGQVKTPNCRHHNGGGGGSLALRFVGTMFQGKASWSTFQVNLIICSSHTTQCTHPHLWMWRNSSPIISVRFLIWHLCTERGVLCTPTYNGNWTN